MLEGQLEINRLSLSSFYSHEYRGDLNGMNTGSVKKYSSEIKKSGKLVVKPRLWEVRSKVPKLFLDNTCGEKGNILALS